jgi:opacity protein-like surface antigen
MKRFAAFATVVFFLAAAVPLTSQAQMESESAFKIGPRATVALNDISDFGGDFAIGGDVRYDLSASANAPIQLSGAFDYYFVEDRETVTGGIGGVQTEEVSASAYTIDLNGLYSFPVEGAFSPYAGAGLGIVGTSLGDASDTDIGVNLVGGAEFEAGSLRPFAEAQVSFGGDFTRFGITGGVLFAL